MSAIGERLKEERVRLGMNQEDFAVQGGVARNAQANYEKGQRSPDSDYLANVANMGVDILYVLTGTRTALPEAALSATEEAVLKEYRSLTPADQAVIRRMAKTLVLSKPENETGEEV